MHAIPEYPHRDLGNKDGRNTGRKGRNGGGSRPYAHRRRSARAQVMTADMGAALVLRRFWDEHALKAGITVFWLWFAAANWPGLQ